MNRKVVTVFGALLGWAAWTVGIVAELHKVFPGKEGEALAAWAQAVGSIGAVFAVFVIAWWQSLATLRAVRSAQQERRRSIVAVAEAAAELGRRIGTVLDEPDEGHVRMYGVYDKSIVDGTVHALSIAPAHEIGTRDGVVALLALRDQLRWLGMAMEKYLAGPWQLPEHQNVFESCGDDPVMRGKVAEAIGGVLVKNVRTHLDQIQKCYRQLADAVMALEI